MNKFFLLADDDSDDAGMFQEALAEIDSSVIFYRTWDGQEVLDWLNNKNMTHPDIIFLDINMPGMSGWQCLAKLKSSEAFKGIPVIMYSTSSLKRDAEIALDLGALCFITKPDDYDKLKNILEIIVANLDNNLSDALKNCSHISEIKCSHNLEKQDAANIGHKKK